MSRDPRWLRVLAIGYGLALRLYPRGFRRQWEEPMRQAFRDRCREVARGERGVVALLGELLPDLALAAGRERIHAMEGLPMSKRHWMLALLFTFATMLAMHDRLGAMGLAAVDAWKQRQATLDEEAYDSVSRDIGTRLERSAKRPRDHTLAAMFLAAAHEPEAAHAWRTAIDAHDPLGLWLSAVDCPVAACDPRAAIAALERIEPESAAVQLLELDFAARAGDRTAMRDALHRMANARYHDGHEADLAKGLLEAASGGEIPRRLSRRYGGGPRAAAAVQAEVAAGIWMAVAQPAYGPFVTLCRRPSEADIARDCAAAARIFADADTVISRNIGLRVWYRLASSDTEREEVAQRLRNERWVIDNMGKTFQFATADDVMRWRQARLDSANEVEAFRVMLRRRGIPDTPPETFQPDLAALVGR